MRKSLLIITTISLFSAQKEQLIPLNTKGNSVLIEHNDITILHIKRGSQSSIKTLDGKEFTHLGRTEIPREGPEAHLLYKNVIGVYQEPQSSKKIVYCNGPCLIR